MERKGDFISTNIRYKKETEVVTFQGKEITLENLSPVFTPEQEVAKRRELEQRLYEVFRKYADKMCIRDRSNPDMDQFFESCLIKSK